MALTTNNAPEVPRNSPPVNAKKNVEDEVRSRYQKGENLYQIARGVYEFESEEAIERIRRILGIMEPPKSRLMDE